MRRKKREIVDYLEPRIRQVWGWSEGKKAARLKSFIRRDGRIEYHRCAKCNGEFIRRKTHVDHINPVVPVKERRPVLVEPGIAKGWDRYLSRMWCSPKNLQVLCAVCHRQKTALEQKERRKNRSKAA